MILSNAWLVRLPSGPEVLAMTKTWMALLVKMFLFIFLVGKYVIIF